jgi:hypothetical protein
LVPDKSGNIIYHATTARRGDLMIKPKAAGAFPFRVKFIDLINGRVFHIARTVISVTP